MKAYFLLYFGSVLLLSCNNNNAQSQKIDSTRGLKDYYKGYFTMGVSVSPSALKSNEAGLIIKQFGSITPENAMKLANIHPKENEYYWKDADSIVAFAKRNNLKVRGHTLIWYQEIPSWFLEDSFGNPVTKEVFFQRLKEHITTIVTRYKGSVYAWDVVNEAISDDKNDFYRQSKLFQIAGEEFIFKAFEYAHEADPNALLFYNDYNEIDPIKRAKIISLIKKMQASGVPVSAIGLQAHWDIYEPTKEQLETTLKDFSALKLPLQITEMDISIYPRKPYKNLDVDTTIGCNLKKQTLQQRQYKMYFERFRKYKSSITGVTFWDISDKHSWLDNFPIKNRKDYPLLFDTTLKPKKAFWEIALFKN